MDVIQYIIDFMDTAGVLVGFLLVFIECFIPALPLSIFVALNVNSFGFFIGVLISWFATSIGSFFCYLFFKVMDDKIVRKKILWLNNTFDNFNKIKFTDLVLLITLPFTPSFLINVLAGMTKMSYEKFLFAIIIGKSFYIIFWGYIGKSLIASLTDIYSIIYIIIALVIAFIVSKIISKRFNLE